MRSPARIRVAFLVAALALAPTLTSWGQEGPFGPPPGMPFGPPPDGPFGPPPPLSEVLKDSLGLSDDQVEKLRGFEDEMRSQLDSARAEAEKDGGSPDFDKMRETFEAARAAVESKVRSILTEEQLAKLDGVEDALDESGGAPGPLENPRSGGLTESDTLARVGKELSLDPEAKASVLGLVKKLLDAKRAFREADRRRRADLAKFLSIVPGTTDAQSLEIAQKLNELRAAAGRDAAKVREADASLRGAVNVVVEAQLVVAGVLD
jgi:hypothetical protein